MLQKNKISLQKQQSSENLTLAPIQQQSILTMQQDDQNTFKFPPPLTHQHSEQPLQQSQTSCGDTLITKINLLKEGLNFIVPAFWYQELIQLNHDIKSVDQIELPSVHTMVSYLKLYALQNPSQSPFTINQQYSALSTPFLSDLLDESNFNQSKTLKFSKLNDSVNATQIQWKLITPYLWNLITNILKNNQSFQDNDCQSSYQSQISSRQQLHELQMPNLAVMLRKEFILQNGASKTSPAKSRQVSQPVTVYCKNNKYLINKEHIQSQIRQQLKTLSTQQINLLIIIDKTLNHQMQLKKLTVSGFFPQLLPFKELIKSLIQISSQDLLQIGEKFFVYNQFGEKIPQKISTVANLYNHLTSKQIIVTTLPVHQIDDRRNNMQNVLRSLLAGINSDRGGEIEQQNNGQISDNLVETSKLLEKVSKQIEYKKIKKHIIQELQKLTPSQSQTKQHIPFQQVRSGFKPFIKPGNQSRSKVQISYDIKLGKSPSFQQSQHPLNQTQNQQDLRYLQSLTTNMDTPQQQDNQSQLATSSYGHKPSSYGYRTNSHEEKTESQEKKTSSYQNKRLHRHWSYNRQQRKRKAQIYLHKKKKNTVILKDNSENRKKSGVMVDLKRRIKHSLFDSLVELGVGQDREMLEYLLENMRVVAREIMYAGEKELIRHPYMSGRDGDRMQEQGVQSSQQKPQRVDTFMNDNNSNQPLSIQNKQHIIESLQRISFGIQQKYEPLSIHNNQQWQKQPLEQLQKIQLFSQYENQLSFKKDNQQIKTIVDNSEGPYSEIEKQQHYKVKYQFSEKKTQKNILLMEQNDEVNSLTDQAIHYHQQTL